MGVLGWKETANEIILLLQNIFEDSLYSGEEEYEQYMRLFGPNDVAKPKSK